MKPKREIEITIDEDGNIHLEGFGFEGKSCSLEMHNLAKQLGRKVKETNKDEYYSKQKIKVKNTKG